MSNKILKKMSSNILKNKKGAKKVDKESKRGNITFKTKLIIRYNLILNIVLLSKINLYNN